MPGSEERLFTGREVGDFLLRACHDLRTPLRGIGLHAELLAKDNAIPQISGCDPRLTFIVEGAAKMDRLVDWLSGYSLALRIDPATFVAAPAGVLLRAAVARLDREHRDRQAEVTYGDMPRLTGDPDRLVQLFELLLRYRSPVCSRIHITASPRGERWLFTSQDDGPSVEASDLERIFQPFAPDLALATCREIVERHGGRIWAESRAESQKGSRCTFFFTLPAAPE